MPKQPLSERSAYPIVFVFLLSVVFVGILSAMFRFNESRINQLRTDEYQRTVLSLSAEAISKSTGEDVNSIKNDYPESFSKYIEVIEGEYNVPAFLAKHQGKTLALVFDISGKGLWGSMKALVATDPDINKIISLSVYEQVETPGLGARITEEWFTNQFKTKQVVKEGRPVDLVLIPEGQDPKTELEIRQVTGATITSSAVIKMLQSEMLDIVKSKELSK